MCVYDGRGDQIRHPPPQRERKAEQEWEFSWETTILLKMELLFSELIHVLLKLNKPSVCVFFKIKSSF